jgi:DNA-binding response OmpR family regulator
MLRILLVEDEPDIALVISIALEEAGHHVTVAHDGLAGLEIALQETPEIVITDLMMPRLSGLEMIARLRQAGYDRPIVLTSAVPKVDMGDLRIDAFLMKPYTYASLLVLINSFFDD